MLHANPPDALPETIGYVSTALLDKEHWDEFWEKISRVNVREPIGSVYFLQHAFVGNSYAFVFISLFDNLMGLKYGYYAMAMLAIILYASPWFWWNYYKLSKIQDICAAYSLVFQAAGFRVQCTMEYPEQGRNPLCYYLYFYPLNPEYQCITIADETIFGSYCSKYPIVPSNDTASNVGASATSELWDEFCTKLVKAAADFCRAYQRYRFFIPSIDGNSCGSNDW